MNVNDLIQIERYFSDYEYGIQEIEVDEDEYYEFDIQAREIGDYWFMQDFGKDEFSTYIF